MVADGEKISSSSNRFNTATLRQVFISHCGLVIPDWGAPSA
jgi:hypothetical protein